MAVIETKYLYKVLELPKHLQTTFLALLRSGVADANSIAKITGKARAVESAYLNILKTMKMVKKSKQKCKTIFQIDLESVVWY